MASASPRVLCLAPPCSQRLARASPAARCAARPCGAGRPFFHLAAPALRWSLGSALPPRAGGRTRPRPPRCAAAPPPESAAAEAAVYAELRRIIDPDFGADIVECGFVKELLVEPHTGRISFVLELTTPVRCAACGAACAPRLTATSALHLAASGVPREGRVRAQGARLRRGVALGQAGACRPRERTSACSPLSSACAG